MNVVSEVLLKLNSFICFGIWMLLVCNVLSVFVVIGLFVIKKVFGSWFFNLWMVFCIILNLDLLV